MCLDIKFARLGPCDYYLKNVEISLNSSYYINTTTYVHVYTHMCILLYPTGAERRMFRGQKSSVLAANALAACVGRTSAAMVLIVHS